MKSLFGSACLGASSFMAVLLLLSISGCSCVSGTCTGACPTLAGGVTCDMSRATCASTSSIVTCHCNQLYDTRSDGTGAPRGCICQ